MVFADEWLSYPRGFCEESLQWAISPKEGLQGGHLKGRELQKGPRGDGHLRSQPCLSLPSSSPYLLLHDVPAVDEHLFLMPPHQLIGFFLQRRGIGLQCGYRPHAA